MDAGRSFNGALGLCEKIKSVVDSLTESAILLQEAIMSRKSQAIWTALSGHQTLASELERLFELWARLFYGQPAAEEDAVRALRAQIKAASERLRSIERVNARLSLTYLGAVRKILAATGISIAPKKSLYNASGRFGRANTSVLLNKIG